jgi:hypothetical protein
MTFSTKLGNLKAPSNRFSAFVEKISQYALFLTL